MEEKESGMPYSKKPSKHQLKKVSLNGCRKLVFSLDVVVVVFVFSIYYSNHVQNRNAILAGTGI